MAFEGLLWYRYRQLYEETDNIVLMTSTAPRLGIPYVYICGMESISQLSIYADNPQRKSRRKAVMLCGNNQSHEETVSAGARHRIFSETLYNKPSLH